MLSNHWGQSLTKRSRITSKNTKDVFTLGQCHSLALAIHDLTGFPLYGVDYVCGSPDHIVVKTDKGYLDIRGYRDYNDPKRLNREYVATKLLDEGYKIPEVDNAIPFAKKLLKLHNIAYKTKTVKITSKTQKNT